MAFIARLFGFVAGMALASAVAQAQSKTPVVDHSGLCRLLPVHQGDHDQGLARHARHPPDRLPFDTKLDPKTLEHEPCGILRELVRILNWRIADQYGPFIKHVESKVAPGTKVIEFAYDWRLSADYNAGKLREVINRESPGAPVDILAHSFGGVVARAYVHNHGGANRVRQIITMGTPHRGSVDTFETLYEGWDGWAINRRMGGAVEIRKTLLTFPGFYDLLPNYANCCQFASATGGKEEPFSAFDPKAWSRFSWYKSVFGTPAQEQYLVAQLARARTLHRDTLEKPLPGNHESELWLIATGVHDTITRIYIDDKTGERLRFERKGGDGTVPFASAINGRRINDKAISSSPGQHMSIYAEASAKETVARAMVGGFAPTGGGLRATTIRSKDRGDITISAISFKVAPGMIEQGEAMGLSLLLTGETKLAGADLSEVAAVLVVAGKETALPLETSQSTSGSEASVAFVARFNAPAAPGTYRVRVRIPGVTEEFQDVFVVVEK